MRPWLLLACAAALFPWFSCSPPSDETVSTPSPPKPADAAPAPAFVVTVDPVLNVDRVDWIRGEFGTWYRDECVIVRERRLDGSLEVRVNGFGDLTGASVTFRLHRDPSGTAVAQLVDQRDRTDFGADPTDAERSCVAARGEIVLNNENFFADKLACRYVFEGEWRVARPGQPDSGVLEKVHTEGEFALPYRP